MHLPYVRVTFTVALRVSCIMLVCCFAMCVTAVPLQGLRVYDQQGKLLASWQEQLSDTVQSQLQVMFQSLVNSFLSIARVKVRAAAPQ